MEKWASNPTWLFIHNTHITIWWKSSTASFSCGEVETGQRIFKTSMGKRGNKEENNYRKKKKKKKEKVFFFFFYNTPKKL